MKKNGAIIFLAAVWILAGMTGCKKTDGAGSPAAASANAEMSRMESLLEQTRTERDELKAKVSEVTASLKSAQTKMEELMQNSSQTMAVKDKLDALAKERDAALAKASEAQAMIDTLKGQVQEQLQKLTGLEGQNQKLQDTIEQLKKQLSSGNMNMPDLPKP